MALLVVIDNYDSFTYNLVQMFMAYDLDIQVLRSDCVTVAQVLQRHPDYLLISPGPRDPIHAGISTALVRRLHHSVPTLGVCLGMQCINEAFGGRTVRAPVPVHGKTSRIRHQGQGVFAGIPSPFVAARYHSLVVEPAPDAELLVTAHSEEGVIMGLRHPRHPLHGVQFHPESFLTPHGRQIIDNFLGFGPLGQRSCNGIH